MGALKGVPDPRDARGKRYPWWFLLALVCCALASGQRSVHAIAHWITLHGAELVSHLQLRCPRVPSESTIGRALRMLDVALLEQAVARVSAHLASAVDGAGIIEMPQGGKLRAQAIDGKTLRGTYAHGQRVHLVSLCLHGSGIVLAQTAVAETSNEITAVPQLLAGRDLSGTVTTLDAMHTQRTTAQQIVDHHGHYLMVVKSNQAELHNSITLLFEQPPWTRQERAAEYQTCRTWNKRHGRFEIRILECSTTLCDYLDWPAVGQVVRRHCCRLNLKTGEASEETTYAVTSLRPAQAGVAHLEALCRGHWTIENRVHYVRDVTLGEDATQVHKGNAPTVLAALRNAILNLLRHAGWANIADALRYYAASVGRALHLIGAIPTPTLT
jgi:predicted transposase YbfD/YdcC